MPARKSARPRIVDEFIGILDPLLSKKAVSAAVSLSQVHLMRMVRSGEFPEPLRIGQVRICWRASTVQAWIDSLTSVCKKQRNPYGRKGKPKMDHIAP
jgi:predicted DNA-binding transcriptional regulator AlpA